MTLSTETNVKSHTRAKPFAKVKAAKTAQLRAELDAEVDKQIAAAFRTFPINVARALKAGRL